jgi:UDP-glucose 4-epimerase
MTHSFTHAIITGGAGFIGSNLADRLLADGLRVTVFDNFSTGMHQFLAEAKKNPNFTLVEGDNLDLSALVKAMQGCDFVFHLAANADVRFGTHHPEKDLQQNTIATFNVLEAMRHNNIRRIAFSSTGSIYGEPDVFPTPEDAPFPVQTSLYGASKLAGEGLISAYAEGYDYQGYIFRFVSVLGERYTHGHVFDFYQKLKNNPHQMEVLGNGKQRKSYMYVQDCLDAMLLAVNKAQDKVNIFNLGSDGYTDVNGSIGWITNYLGVQPQLKYTGGERGWIGDSPFIFLDTKKIQSLGWKPTLTIEQGVIKTLQWIQQNEWIYGQRAA